MSRAHFYAVMLAALVLAVPLASGAASDQPSTPTIDSAPPNPSASGSATLSFSDADPLVTFRCQIDGGVFSLCTSPATYSGLADGSHTFAVKAVDLLLNESDVASYTWSVDTTPPPAPAITAQPSNPSNDSSPAFQFTDTEGGVSFQCKLDSGGFAACASPAAYTGQADGSHTFTVQASDAAGNTSSTSYGWVIDTVVPTITLGTKPTNPSNDPTPSFSFGANEAIPGGFECKLDNGTFAACTSPTTLGSTLDGSHTFIVRATDTAGNTGQTSYSWTIDTVAPTVTVGTKPPNPSNDPTPTFAFSANEATPGGFECKLDSGAFAGCTSPATLSASSDGSHTFSVRADDAAGNIGSATHTWTIDTVAPTVTLGTKPPSPSNDPTPSFSFSAAETSTFQCELDAGAFAPCTSPTTLGATADGSHTYTVKATDAAGNAGQASYVWTIDTVAPTTTLTAKPANSSNDPTPSFSFSAGETSTFQCELDAGAFAPCTSPTTLGATADGSHTYTVKATDAAGNTGPVTSHVWTIDTVAPTITLSIKPSNPTNDTTPDFAFSANETVPAGFQCQLDASAFAACTSPKALTATADGSHTFTVKAVDAAGNPGQTSYTWTIDTAVPQITLGTKPTNPTNDPTPDFAFSANETLLGGFQCQLDGGAFAACTSPKAFPVTADGSHTFTVKAIDTAGNPGQTSYTWTIDTDSPTITLTQTPSNFSSDSTPTFAFTADEPIPGGFQCRLDAGGTFAPCSSPTTLGSTAEGLHTFTVRGNDTAGNLGQTSYAWTIDTVAPALSLTAKPSDPSGVSTAHFEFSATDQTSVTYQCQLDAGAFQSCTSPKDFSGLANGPHSFTAKGTDAAGNTGSASYSWSVDTAVPVVTVNQAPVNPTNLTGATFSFTSSKLPSTFECQLDGGGFSVCTSPKTYGPLAAGAHSFQVRATDSLGHTGPATTYSWTIDLTPPPTPAISSAPASPSNSSSPSFVFTDGESGASFQCQLDGGAFVSCTSPRAYSGLADGPHSFNVKAIDAAGNQSGPAGHTWTIDTVAPTITLGTKPVNPTNDSTPDFAFSANETISGGFQCKLDAAAFAVCTSPKTLPATTDGSHTFTVKANDTAGNTGQTIYTWTIDTDPPTITLASPPNPSNDATPTFTFSADESTPGGFQCKLDAAAFAVCTSPKTLPATTDGSHTFTVKANDTAGNTGQTIYTWTIDTDPPTITLASPPNPSNDATPTFTFSADEATPGGFQCKLDAAAFAVCTSPKTLPATTDGSHTFTVKGADSAGNNSSTSYAWTIDTIAPVLTLTKTPADPSGVATAHFEFSATDQTSVSYQCQLDGGSFLPCATPPGQDYSSLTSAAHTFTLKGTDAAGNSITKPFTWTVDTVNPVVTITAGPPNPSNQVSPTFTFTSNKSPSTFQCQLDTSAFAPCTSPLTLGATPEGSHTFKVRATDSLNHTGGPTAFSWTIDTTPPPAPAIGSGPANPTNLTSASFVFSDSESGLSFQCKRDGGAFSTCASPASYSGLPNGAHTFAVRSTDAAGNTGAAASKGWTVDTVPPNTTIASTPPAVSGSGSASFGFTSTEPGSTFACSLDGGTFASCSPPQGYSGLANGAHAFRVKATDAAGNSDPTVAAYSWEVAVFTPVDRTPPGNVRGLKRTVGYGLLEMAWGLPPDTDFDHVRVLLSTSPKKPARSVVYTGKARRYLNRSFKNGTYYRYSVVSYDRAGNASHGVTVVVAASALLRSPRDGSVVHSPPLFRWSAIKRASYYNVQLYHGARKVLSRWPGTARLRLGRTWTYQRQNLRLRKGTYHWYVWPGFGPRLKARYGQLLGESTFRVG